jgi:hypothetical protein
VINGDNGISNKDLAGIYNGPKIVTFIPGGNLTTTIGPAEFKPYAIMFQFPSGEWSVERFATEDGARAAAAEAAHEAPGRVVHVVERKAAVMLPENALVWNG